MPLIDTLQRDYFLNKAAILSLQQVNLNNLNNNFQDVKFQNFGLTNTYGNPFTKVLVANLGKVIDIVAIQQHVATFYDDIDILNQGLKITSQLCNQDIIDMVSQVENLKKVVGVLSTKIDSETSRISNNSTWTFADSFNTVFNVDMINSTISVDTSIGRVYLPEHQTTIQPINAIQTTGQALVVTSNLSNIFNTSVESWKLNTTSSSTFATVLLTFNNSDIDYFTIDPVGFGLQIDYTVNGSTIITGTQVFYEKTCIQLNAKQVTSIKLVISCNSTTYPKVVGIKSLIFYSSVSALTGSLYSKVFSNIPSFSSLYLGVNETVPSNTTINWFYSNGVSGWTQINPNTWNTITNTNYATAVIPPLVLQTNQSYTIPSSTTNNSFGYVSVGVNQFEVSTTKTNSISGGKLNYIPTQALFTGLNRAWSNISYSVNPLTTTSCPVQALSPGVDLGNVGALPGFSAGGTIVGSLNSSLGSALLWVPISSGQKSLQSNFHYRFTVNVFCQEAVTISNAAYWFIQGYKTPGSLTFKQQQFGLGSFAMYINDVLVCGEQYPDTIYSDGSCDTAASLLSGKNYNFSLLAGWNKIEYHIYCPDIPSYLIPNDYVGNPELLQLVVYPNIFDTNIQHANNITAVSGSGQYNAIPYFDLIWKVPKSYTYWSWSETTQSTVLFNTSNTSVIDYYYGGNNLNSYPNITLYYQTSNSITQTLQFRADLTSSDPKSLPQINSYSAEVK